MRTYQKQYGGRSVRHFVYYRVEESCDQELKKTFQQDETYNLGQNRLKIVHFPTYRINGLSPCTTMVNVVQSGPEIIQPDFSHFNAVFLWGDGGGVLVVANALISGAIS